MGLSLTAGSSGNLKALEPTGSPLMRRAVFTPRPRSGFRYSVHRGNIWESFRRRGPQRPLHSPGPTRKRSTSLGAEPRAPAINRTQDQCTEFRCWLKVSRVGQNNSCLGAIKRPYSFGSHEAGSRTPTTDELT